MCIQGILPSPVGCSLNHARPALERPLRLTRGQGRGASRTIVWQWGVSGRGARENRRQSELWSDSREKEPRPGLRLGADPAGTAC